MKYNIGNSENKVEFTFNLLEGGDIFYLVELGMKHLFMKLKSPIAHEYAYSFKNKDDAMYNAISIEDGKLLHIAESSYVGQLITPITFYGDDFVTCCYEQESVIDNAYHS